MDVDSEVATPTDATRTCRRQDSVPWEADTNAWICIVRRAYVNNPWFLRRFLNRRIDV